MDIPLFPNKSIGDDLTINDTQLFIDEFELYFDQQIIGEIQKAIDNRMGVAAYILISCAIDCLASFWQGSDSGTKIYIDFVNTFFVGYNAEHLYKDLRCRLVHNYTLGEKLIMCWDEPGIHKSRKHDGKIVINLEQFFEDFKQAKDSYFTQVRCDRELQIRLANRWLEVGILSPICPDAVRDAGVDSE